MIFDSSSICTPRSPSPKRSPKKAVPTSTRLPALLALTDEADTLTLRKCLQEVCQTSIGNVQRTESGLRSVASDAINGDNSGLKPAVAEIQSGCDPVESALLRALEQRRKQNHISQQSRACAKTRPWRFDGSRGPEASSVEDYAIAIGSSSPDDITMEAMTCTKCREQYDPSWNDCESCEYHTGQFFKLEYNLAISLFSLGEMEINFDGAW